MGELGTRARLEAAATLMRAPLQESEAWITGFEFLQMLRLQAQVDEATADGARPADPNLIDIATLNDIDLRMLKETMRIARRLQQRIELDYQR
jgi:CBS domain-containing protein